ncbi:MAG: Blue (Type 1) copper protein [Parcubacteria group bacterium]|nr:Blue (Type 1) copper protein [Parcubacteria group bacterium]
MSKNIVLTILGIIVIIGAFFAIRHNENPDIDTSTQYGTDSDGMDMGTTTEVTASSTISVTVPDLLTVKEVTVNGSNFAFDPKTITVNKGDTVKITFKNVGGMHDFKIDEFNVATKKINGGESDTVTFVADKTGSFEYYCSVGTHRQMGMKGTLIVK